MAASSTADAVHAVHDDDLETFLKSLGIFSDFEAGRLRCWFCDTQITFQNLEAVFPDSGTVHVTCSLPACVTRLLRHLEER